MTNKIKVVLVEPNKKAVVTEIESTLGGMQEVVGGLIEAIYPFDDNVALICNEEGKIMSLPANRAIRMEGEKEIFDIIAGTFFIAGLEGEHFISLTKPQIEKYWNKFLYPEKFMAINGQIKAFKYEVF